VRRAAAIIVTAIVAVVPWVDQGTVAGTTVARVALRPTSHPQLPADLSQLWLVPVGAASPSPALQDLGRAVALESSGQYEKALALLAQPSVAQSRLGAYAALYKGNAELHLGRAAEARATFRALQAQAPVGYVAEAAALGEAESAEVLGEPAAAAAIYEQMLAAGASPPDDLLFRLGKAAKAAGERVKAHEAFTRLYYEFPLSDLAAGAGAEPGVREPVAAGSDRYGLELWRAQRLFDARRYGEARAAFARLQGAAHGDDRELVALRVAECSYFLKRYREAGELLRPHTREGSRQAEALFHYALSQRALRNPDGYVTAVRRILSAHPAGRWTEEALNDLATHYTRRNADDDAAQTFRQLYERFPTGRHAERAAWKVGWKAFRSGDYRETVRVFERASADFPRSDYRPMWLYWAGRAHESLGQPDLADARYRLVALDYLNSYYGRLAVRRLRGPAPVRRLVFADTGALSTPAGFSAETPAAAQPPNGAIITALLGLKLYAQALDELRYAQRTWGDRPALQATIAWTYRQMGRTESGTEQFNHYRGAITIMRRAYPQFMAAGGEDLPGEILEVIFPLEYRDVLAKHAAARGLDPAMLAALVAQESTFVPEIRSAAKAVGLMQLRPVTARRYARALKIRYSSKLLTSADANVRLGTAYLADTLREFGDLSLALASYNAGEGAVRRWRAERPGLSGEEFVDDIPYPETQQYVKKILGMAEDYRRLYGSDIAEPVGTAARLESAGP
jgi:soluble lytic murein transglycosylase